MLFSKSSKIGQYTVVFQHKQGANAETYRVKDSNGKTRFLKLINCNRLNRHQINDDGQIVEIEIAKQLKHKNLCRFIENGDLIVDGCRYAYFVTEYVSGETLSQKIVREGDLSIYEIKEIAKSVLSALDFLHSLPMPIIHNEVTIQNVMMNFAGDINDLKLIDFGHARLITQPHAKPDLEVLNPFCLAPERFAGISSPRTDIYSVGVMLYQLIYNELPWFFDISHIEKSERVDAILSRREKELKVKQLDDRFELDDQLINCISKALSYDAESRFASAAEFMKAIDGETKIEHQSTRRKNPSDNAKPEKSSSATEKKGEGFAAVAGMDELKKQLREEIIEPLNNPEEYHRYGVTIPNGMLLYGPPGCGKTFFAKHFAEEVGFNFECVTPATLKSRWVNATQENIAKMFAEAEKNAPTIIFIDEINELVPNRESNVHEMSKAAVNEMLAQMDRTGERGIFVIGATNYPHTIDPAILRAGRMEKKYYVGAPDFAARQALFEHSLSKRPIDFGLDYSELARLTEGYISADISLIANDAAREALHRHAKITMQLLRETIANHRPSLNSEELARYERIRAEMDGEIPQKDSYSRPKIGF